MKKMMFTLMAMLTLAMQANAMSYEQARNEALFLTDKMAYELNLTDAQYEAAYEINLDYLMGVTSQYDVFGPYWERRNLDLSYILFSWQWDAFCAASYFYRPLYWNAGYWHFGIYARYPHRDYFYFGRPHFYATYRGGHSWRMNNNRSFYEGRRDFYRPEGHNRDQHFGMRNGWNRGDYRNAHGGHPSSTHITGGEHRPSDFGNNGGGHNRGDFGGSRRDDNWRNNGANNGGTPGGNMNNNGGHNRSDFGGSTGNGGSFGGGSRGGGNTGNGGSFGGGSRSGGNTGNGGSFGGGSRGGSNPGNGGSFGGGSRGGSNPGNGGSFGGGSRGGGSNRSGSIGGGGGRSGGGRR